MYNYIAPIGYTHSIVCTIMPNELTMSCLMAVILIIATIILNSNEDNN
jgi:hypothetical protein